VKRVAELEDHYFAAHTIRPVIAWRIAARCIEVEATDIAVGCVWRISTAKDTAVATGK
jgi:hypothetical protein